MQEPASSPPHRPYLLLGLRKPENAVAALATALTLLGVAALASIPLAPGFEVDLREPDDFRGTAQWTPSGLSRVGRFGRSTLGPAARFVLNRPLPETFELEVEAWSYFSGPEVAAELRIGEERHRAVFGEKPGVRTFAVRNPAGVREIVLHLDAGVAGERAPELAVRRLAVR